MLLYKFIFLWRAHEGGFGERNLNKKECIVEWAAGAVVVLIKNSRRERKKKIRFQSIKNNFIVEGRNALCYIYILTM